ncbi:MAG: glutamine amidotransferase [bacterium]
MKNKLTLVHLYPDNMNLYGDLGNIVTLMMRCQWRNLDLEIQKVKIGDQFDLKNADIIFLGGGQDLGQKTIAKDLLRRKGEIKEEVEQGLVALTVCGGFQLFGKYFQTSKNEQIPGISVFDCYTVADQKRLIGNVVVDIEKSANEWHTEINFPRYKESVKTLVGFENHSGKTILGKSCKPLGYVKIGYGNQGDGGYEGGVYKNAFGTYLHGSLLPKNPWFADYLITLAYYRRYKKDFSLLKLDDSIEIAAHRAAISRAQTAKTLSI